MINCALIGFGYWGPNIARTLLRIPEVNLKYICDASDESIKKIKNQYSFLQTTKDVEILLQDKDLNAVIIATPAQTHYKLASRFLNKSINTFIEKPLATSSQDVLKLRKLSKNGITIMVGHTFEYNPAVLKIKEIISNKKDFGDIFYMYSLRVNLGQIRGDINALWNLAPHDISMGNLLLDMTPTEVSAIGVSYLQNKLEDVVFLNIKYPNNILYQVHVSWLDPSKERKLTIVGSKKMIIFDDMDNEMPIKIYDKHADTGDIAKNSNLEYKIKLHSGDIYIPQINYSEPLFEELKHFFDCINHKTKPKTDVENGLKVVKVLEAAEKSIKQKGKWIKI